MGEALVREAPAPARPRDGGGAGRWVAAGLAAAAVAGGGWYWYAHGGPAHGASHEGHGGAAEGRNAAAEAADAEAAGKVRVEVTKPHAGGLGRTTEQPGTVHAFEYADLYAKVSGYLKSQSVDIGDRVKRGDLLAEIDAPELNKAVDQAAASVTDARAHERQAEASVRAAEAGVKSAQASLGQAKADVEKFVSQRTYRQKELERIRDLARRNAIEQKLVDEQTDRYESALAAERSAEAAVQTADAQVAEARARVDKARADLDESRAAVQVAEADLAKAKVMVDYTRITSPYDGVITHRGFHRGDFIRSAADGAPLPVLSVARTDLMRVVTRVPDLDVPFLDRNDPAVVTIKALDDRHFQGKVARSADSEDLQDRTMRAEVDLPNPDGRLRDGMYGLVTVTLEPPTKNLTVPSSCLTALSGDGSAEVYVVRDGKAHQTKVRVGRDNGVESEVLEGLRPDDDVVVRYTGSLAEGVGVVAQPVALAASGPAAGH